MDPNTQALTRSGARSLPTTLESTNSYTSPGNYTLTVAAGKAINVDVKGASGTGGTSTSGSGGAGGRTQGTYLLTSSTTLYIQVGSAGSASGTGGTPGGGTGYAGTYGPGGGGGGYSGIFFNSASQANAIFIAGGGGGAGWYNGGGAGGGTTGGSGSNTYGGPSTSGGSQVAGAVILEVAARGLLCRAVTERTPVTYPAAGVAAAISEEAEAVEAQLPVPLASPEVAAAPGMSTQVPTTPP